MTIACDCFTMAILADFPGYSIHDSLNPITIFCTTTMAWQTGWISAVKFAAGNKFLNLFLAKTTCLPSADGYCFMAPFRQSTHFVWVKFS